MESQYHTYSGSNRSNYERPSINSIFHRAHNISHSLDEYKYTVDGERSGYRGRFDNTSFVKSISIDENQPDQDQNENKQGNNRSHNHHHHPHHHHHNHSISEMFKSLGKKVHIWPRKNHNHQSTSSGASSPLNDPQENFRMRSKSLDVTQVNRAKQILNDCESTYKIYENIVKGKTFSDFFFFRFQMVLVC